MIYDCSIRVFSFYFDCGLYYYATNVTGTREPFTVMSLLTRFTRNFHTCIYHIAARNHYEVLGVPRDASRKEIKAAFISLSKQLHPDVKNPSNKSEISFVDVNEAYSVLSDSVRRREYDLRTHPYNTRPSYPYNTHHGPQPTYWQHRHQHYGWGSQFYDFSHAEYKRSSPRFSNGAVFGFISGILLVASLIQFLRFRAFQNNLLKASMEESKQRHISYGGGVKERIRKIQKLKYKLEQLNSSQRNS